MTQTNCGFLPAPGQHVRHTGKDEAYLIRFLANYGMERGDPGNPRDSDYATELVVYSLPNAPWPPTGPSVIVREMEGAADRYWHLKRSQTGWHVHATHVCTPEQGELHFHWARHLLWGRLHSSFIGLRENGEPRFQLLSEPGRDFNPEIKLRQTLMERFPAPQEPWQSLAQKPAHAMSARLALAAQLWPQIYAQQVEDDRRNPSDRELYPSGNQDWVALAETALEAAEELIQAEVRYTGELGEIVID